MGAGTYDYICNERLKNGTKCHEASNLAFMDSSESLFHFRDSCFPAMQPDYMAPSNFDDNEVIPFNQRNMENIVIMVDDSVKTTMAVSLGKKERTVSFRSGDSFVKSLLAFY